MDTFAPEFSKFWLPEAVTAKGEARDEDDGRAAGRVGGAGGARERRPQRGLDFLLLHAPGAAYAPDLAE